MASRYTRRGFLAAAGLASVAGCLGGGSASDGGSQPTDATDSPSPTAAPTSTAAGSGPPTASSSLPLPMSGDELRQEARSGGPPKDGIPSVDDPSFTNAEQASERLDGGDIVF
ncbi:MAG: hypothetical protein ABEH59_05530 [Halobacteriales archaeon]